MMRRFIKDLRSGGLFGKGLASFINKDYEKAIVIFTEYLELDNSDISIGTVSCYIGRSHFELKNYNDASKYLSQMWEIHFQKKINIKERLPEGEFNKTLKVFHDVLSILGREEQAQKVAQEIKTGTEKGDGSI